MMGRLVCIGCSAVLALLGLAPAAPARAADGSFAPLARKLIRDGYDTTWVRRLYDDPRCAFMPDIARINIRHVEDTAAYRSFLSETNLAIAREYHGRMREALKRHEARHGVPPEIVVAILLVETKCGRDREKAPVFNVLSTIASSAERAQVSASFAALKEQFPDITRGAVQRRARSRSKWAYRELRALLDWSRRRSGVDVLRLGGSWAGALGLPQFMPTSLKAFGVDGDGDGVVDLFKDDDAIASIGNYFRKNGWVAGKPAREQRKVIWRYNHSPLYVDTVLKISEELLR